MTGFSRYPGLVLVVSRCNTKSNHDRYNVVVYYCRTYVKAVRGRRVKRGDVCYGMLRAAACVDESDHHALYT